MRVFINPGHSYGGNPDPGACGCGLRESDVAASVGELVQKYLDAAGCTTELLQSRHNSLSELSSAANAWGADVFVSIHCNSADSSMAKGTETFCFPYSKYGEILARCIQTQIVSSLPVVDRGVKEANFHVLRETDMPACLVELAFICSESDAEMLRTRQDAFARAIARGVTDYELATR